MEKAIEDVWIVRSVDISESEGSIGRMLEEAIVDSIFHTTANDLPKYIIGIGNTYLWKEEYTKMYASKRPAIEDAAQRIKELFAERGIRLKLDDLEFQIAKHLRIREE